MSVLADSSIRQLCTGDYQVPGDLVPQAHYIPPPLIGAAPQNIRMGEGDDEIHSIPGNLNQTIEVRYPPRITNGDRPMITPFVGHLVRENEAGHKIISYGLSSYGYDVRLKRDRVRLFTNANAAIVDPMSPDDRCFLDAEIHETDTGIPYFILPPNSYALAATVEYFCIPKNVSVICMGKSTYARSCMIVNVTPIEAGFEGEVVIEVSNGSTLPIRVYLETGIAQFQFLQGDVPCELSYADGNRKYQGQRGVTLSRT